MNGLIKTASFMAVATLLSKVLGMIRDVLIANYYGVSAELSAFLAASKMPILMFEMVLGGVISSAFIPVFNDILERKGKPEAMNFAGDYVRVTCFITLIIMTVGLIFAQSLITIVAPGLDDVSHQLAVKLSNIMLPMVIFTGLAFSFVGILQSFGQFTIPAIMSLVSNLVIIAYFVIFKTRFGVTGLSVAMLIGWAVQMLIQVPHLYKFGFRFKFGKFNLDQLKISARLALPMLISTWVQPVYSVVTMSLASSIDGDSGIAVLEYSGKLYLIVVGVFTFVVTNLLFPRLSRSQAAQDESGVVQLILTSIWAVAFVIIPVMVLVAILSEPLVSVLYQRGAFTADAAKRTADVLSCYSFGMLAMGLCEVLNKSFFAAQDSKTPMVTSMLSIAVFTVFALIFPNFFGINGLALAVAAATTVNAAVNLFLIHKHLNGLFKWLHFKKLFPMILGGILCAILAHIVGGFFQIPLLQLLLGGLAGGLGYLSVTLLFYRKGV